MQSQDIVTNLYGVVQRLTLKLVEQGERIAYAADAVTTKEGLQQLVSTLSAECSETKRALSKSKARNQRDSTEIESLRHLVTLSDSERNTAWHQVNVVTERLELAQRESARLQHMVDSCNSRYHLLWADVQVHNEGGQPLKPVFSQRIPTKTRTTCTQTFTPACDPAVIEQISKLEQEAACLTEQMERARANTIAAERATGACQLAAAAELAAAKEETTAALRAVDSERLKARQQELDLRKQLLRAEDEAVQLQETLEGVQGKLRACRLDLSLLERRHGRAVEEMMEHREFAAALELRLGQEMAARESDEAAAACGSRPGRSTLGHTGSCNSRDGANVAFDPCSVVLASRYGSMDLSSEDDNSPQTRSTEPSHPSSHGGESTSSLAA